MAELKVEEIDSSLEPSSDMHKIIAESQLKLDNIST